MCICIEGATSEKVVGEDTRSVLRKGGGDGPRGPRQFRKIFAQATKRSRTKKTLTKISMIYVPRSPVSISTWGEHIEHAGTWREEAQGCATCATRHCRNTNNIFTRKSPASAPLHKNHNIIMCKRPVKELGRFELLCACTVRRHAMDVFDML